MVKFKKLSATSFNPKLRIRVQATGKIGFGEEVTAALKLSTSCYCSFDQDEDSPETLYMTLKRSADSEAFQVRKSGQYFYLNTPRMFDSLGIDYKDNNIFYNMVRMSKYDDELCGEVYRLDLDAKEKPKSDDKKKFEQDFFGLVSSEENINDNI